MRGLSAATARWYLGEQMSDVLVQARRWGRTVSSDDALILAGGRFLQVGLLFGSSIVIARELGPSGRAAYALPLALTGIVWGVCHLSVDRSLLRLIGRRECSVEQAATAALAFGAAVAVSGTLIAIAIGTTWPGLVARASTATMVLAALSLPGMHLTYSAGDLLLIVGKRVAWTVCVTIGCASQLILVLLIAAEHHLKLHEALLVAAISNMISAICLVSALVRSIRPSRALGAAIRLIGRSVNLGVKLHPGSIGLTMNSRFTLLLLGALVPLRDTGYYSLAYNLADAVYSGVVGLGSARLQRQTQLNDDETVRYTRASARTLLVASAAFCIPAAIGCYPLILIAFGHAWLGAVKLAVVLVLSRAIVAPEEMLRTLLERIGPPWYGSAASLLGLAMALAFTALLTLWIGVMGAAIGSTIGFGTYGLALWWLIRRVRRRTIAASVA